MGSKPQTDYLFASPSFFSGAARLMDWYGNFDEYNTSSTPSEADEKAIASDWAVVGEDMRRALGEFERSL